MKEYKVIVARIKVILLWLQIFVWVRVIASSVFHIIFEVFRIFYTFKSIDRDDYFKKVEPAFSIR